MINFLKKNKKKIGICVGICVLIAVVGIFIYYDYNFNIKPISKKTIEEIKNCSADKLMIVAHPDDETLWGGAGLYEKDYYVVCITNGNNKIRKKEFNKILEETGNKGIILSYPDKVAGKKYDWSIVYDDIKADINNIINSKSWSLIVTHNPNGEYGHMHHVMTNEIVTDICVEEDNVDNLFYFGTYYKKSTLSKMEYELPRIDDNLVKFKEQVLKCYESQEGVIEKLGHMIPYEKWIPYKMWDFD